MPNVLAVLLGLAMALVVHEAGHAIAGWMTGLPPREICIGAGPVLYRTQRWGLRFVLRALPIAGFVRIKPNLQDRRLAEALTVAGGAGANLAAMAVFGALSTWLETVETPLIIFARVELVVALGALVPWPVRRGGRRSASDGLQLLRLLFWSRHGRADHVYRAYAKAIGPQFQLPDHPSPAGRDAIYLLANYAAAGADARDRRSIVDRLDALLRQGDVGAAEAVCVIEAVAFKELTYRNAMLTPSELDDWTARAMKLSSSASLRVTRGGALAVLGRPDEARALLKPLLDADLKPVDQLGCRLFLAEAEASLGFPVEAQRMLDAAHRTLHEVGRPDLEPIYAEYERRVRDLIRTV